MTQKKPEKLYVRQLALGPMKNFVYLLGDTDSTEVAVIDPAWDVPAIERQAEADGKKISALVLSHHHHDHVNGVDELLQRHDVPVYAQKIEVDFADVIRGFGSAVRPVDPGEVVTVGTAELKLIHTPGHTPGAQCVLCGGALFSGDTLFVNACGRCDFEGGDPEAMFLSLHQTIGSLPAETELYPGHDYGDVKVSTIQRERDHNPYYQVHNATEFTALRMKPRS